MTRHALILSMLLVLPASMVISSSAHAYPDDIGSIVQGALPSAQHPSRVATVWLSSNGLGVQHIAGWLITAGVYGLCLTTSLPEFIEGDPLLTVVNLSRGPTGSPGNIVNLRPWAAAVARSLGVVMVSFDSDEARHHNTSSFRIALLPIGPARSGGVSIAGCFNFL